MISLKNDKSYCKVIEWFPNYCQLERGCHISNKAPYSNPIQPELSCTCDVKTAHDKATKVIIECFHMTSRRPYWCPKTMEGRPCWCPKTMEGRPYWCPKTMEGRPYWCPKPVPWKLNSFFVQTFSFVPINLDPGCWPRE